MKFFLPLTFSFFVGSAGAILAQNPPQQTPPPQERQANPQAVTVTGCLTKATTEGEYVIADSKSGEKYTFPGPDRLQTYLNHTVELTGVMADQGGDRAFQPKTIRSVSDSCSQ